MKSPKIIISGGGTGGHIFPAIAIANALKKLRPDTEILFVGAQGKMEMEKVPAAGYEIEGLWISGLQRKLTLKNLSFPFKVIHSLFKARGIIRKFKPQVAVGVGGYASGPLLRAAGSKGVHTVLQEQNGFPGITNRVLAKKADKICVAYDGMDRWFPKDKIVLTGNPVRRSVVEIEGKREEALKHFGLDGSRKTVLAVGGSLGARTINQSMHGLLDRFEEEGANLIWQTGKWYTDEAAEALSDRDTSRFFTSTFIKEMDLAYAAADIIVSRAGAIAISELTLVGKPVILIPSPHVAEDHQTKNAMALVQKDAAVLVKDMEARDTLGSELFGLINDTSRCSQLSSNIKTMGRLEADKEIAELILKLAGV